MTPSPRDEPRPEQVDVFEQALASLTRRDRLLIELRVQRGWTFQKVATRFDTTSPDVVRMAYYRALKRFRDVVRRLIADPPRSSRLSMMSESAHDCTSGWLSG